MPRPEILDVPPEEAVRHFRAKGLHAGFHWQDTDAASHLRSFTAAKAMKLDVLDALRSEVDRAIAEGSNFQEFHEALQPRLVKMGWWGRQQVLDPASGKMKLVTTGSPRRLRIIFDTNLRMSYARGRWERIERTAEFRPWLRYNAVLDVRTRPQHRAWHGLVLPWDHPFWRTHFPPNGWRCRCSVQQFSDDDLEEFGFTLSGEPPPGWDQTRPWLNRRQKKTYHIPKGIDPGFQHNPGLLTPGKDDADRLIGKIDAADPEMARAAIGRPWATQLFARHLSGATDSDWPVAVAGNQALLNAIGARSQVVRLSGETAAKQTARHRDVAAADYEVMQRVIDDGEWFHGRGNNALGFAEARGSLWMTVIKSTADRSRIYLQTLHRATKRDLAAARRRYEAVEDNN